MQQTSDGSQEAAFHKLCQLQKLVATYISALEEKQFHREFIDSIFYPQIQNIIANCQSTLNKISKEGKLQTEKISKTITSQ
ncbi:hypothetical protein TRFO_33154 [Tritrichomonas foetus]|uniref:Uncharacterized protein n=1 Tax=Tritrichomonas foetus TaxID=1144522 RepID=A0A1J4JRP7_9EUKA|nr:hypothetical protein TRFO_33154 [Tritrichomonas foetus]|eukprot:OHT00206.1 hypothetical protein TRFO_33154 [Tritrichomonas foetus]